jgi:hypothetical protein
MFLGTSRECLNASQKKITDFFIIVTPDRKKVTAPNQFPGISLQLFKNFCRGPEAQIFVSDETCSEQHSNLQGEEKNQSEVKRCF